MCIRCDKHYCAFLPFTDTFISEIDKYYTQAPLALYQILRLTWSKKKLGVGKK